MPKSKPTLETILTWAKMGHEEIGLDTTRVLNWVTRELTGTPEPEPKPARAYAPKVHLEDTLERTIIYHLQDRGPSLLLSELEAHVAEKQGNPHSVGSRMAGMEERKLITRERLGKRPTRKTGSEYRITLVQGAAV